MNIKDMTHEELDDFIMGRLIMGSNDMSPVLAGHILIERMLEFLVSENLAEPNALFKKVRTFDLKMDIAKAMGLLNDKHYSAFKALNKIRNNYAHKDGYVVSIPELNSLKFDWTDTQTKAFLMASNKGPSEAVKLAVVFLSWKALLLIKDPDAI